MGLFISTIYKTNEMQKIAEDVDAFLFKNSKNPFISAKSILDEMESPTVRNGTPLTLVFREGGKIVGIMPLLIRKTLKIQFAQLLFHYDYSPDLLFDIEYRSLCIQHAINFIFNRLGCSFLSMDLPSESMSLPSIETISQASKFKLQMKYESSMLHCVLPVDCTWYEFEKSKGAKFRKNLRVNEQKLSKAGQWEISIAENSDDERKVFNKILDIEKTCWKEEWRKTHQKKNDVSLLKDWKWSCIAVNTFPGCKRRVWFLNLNGKPIAYNLAIEYKGTIYMCKTSFNNKYRHLFPGIFLNNAAIRDSFNSRRVNMIDFISNLPFQEKWSRMRLFRVRILLTKGLLPKLFTLATQRPQVRMLLSRLIPSELM